MLVREAWVIHVMEGKERLSRETAEKIAVQHAKKTHPGFDSYAVGPVCKDWDRYDEPGGQSIWPIQVEGKRGIRP